MAAGKSTCENEALDYRDNGRPSHRHKRDLQPGAR
jgi:hypothetical protein